jgi:hypothetical protein
VSDTYWLRPWLDLFDFCRWRRWAFDNLNKVSYLVSIEYIPFASEREGQLESTYWLYLWLWLFDFFYRWRWRTFGNLYAISQFLPLVVGKSLTGSGSAALISSSGAGVGLSTT